jgi:hypothetical protein
MKVSMQYAHHSHEESDLLGMMDAQVTIGAFDAINWHQQATEARKLGKVAPTFSVQRGSSLIWVSVSGDPPNIAFVSSYSFPGEVKWLFGLITADGIVEMHRTDMTPQEARNAIEAFAGDEVRVLAKLYNI